jgi:hypothetical protein
VDSKEATNDFEIILGLRFIHKNRGGQLLMDLERALVNGLRRRTSSAIAPLREVKNQKGMQILSPPRAKLLLICPRRRTSASSSNRQGSAGTTSARILPLVDVSKGVPELFVIQFGIVVADAKHELVHTYSEPLSSGTKRYSARPSRLISVL